MRPGEEIRLVKENLAFTVALWKAADAGSITHYDLQPATPGNREAAIQQGPKAGRPIDVTRGAANQMRSAFAMSALQARRSLAVAFPGEPIEEELPELRTALSVMHLIALAVQNSIFRPVWECPPPYRRLFYIRRLGMTLNATGLGGRPFDWNDFGGMDVYLELLEYCAESADAVPEEGYGEAPVLLPFHLSKLEVSGVIGMPQDVEPPLEGASMRPPPGYTENGTRFPAQDEEPQTVFTEEEQPEARPAPGLSLARRRSLVDQFVAERCETGSGKRILAGELYEGFAKWCLEDEGATISQRSFGMRLTALGLKRKRRGHGKHWWEGIRLAESGQTLVGSGITGTQ